MYRQTTLSIPFGLRNLRQREQSRQNQFLKPERETETGREKCVVRFIVPRSVSIAGVESPVVDFPKGYISLSRLKNYNGVALKTAFAATFMLVVLRNHQFTLLVKKTSVRNRKRIFPIHNKKRCNLTFSFNLLNIMSSHFMFEDQLFHLRIHYVEIYLLAKQKSKRIRA